MRAISQINKQQPAAGTRALEKEAITVSA